MISLRPFSHLDKNTLIRILNDQKVSEFLSTKIPNPYTESDADWWINTGSKEGYIRAITLNNQLIGCIGVVTDEFEYSRNGEIGYWFSQESWGKGFATLAVNLITDEVFNNTEINRIHAAVFAGNVGSMRVLEKCGFVAEAVLREAIYKNGQFYDNHIFAKLKYHNRTALSDV